MGKRKKVQTFETAFSRLAEITESLESEGTTLDDSLRLYEEGIELARFCAERLGAAQSRLVELKKRSDGIFETVGAELE